MLLTNLSYASFALPVYKPRSCNQIFKHSSMPAEPYFTGARQDLRTELHKFHKTQGPLYKENRKLGKSKRQENSAPYIKLSDMICNPLNYASDSLINTYLAFIGKKDLQEGTLEYWSLHELLKNILQGRISIQQLTNRELEKYNPINKKNYPDDPELTESDSDC